MRKVSMSTINEDEIPQVLQEVLTAAEAFPKDARGVRRISVRGIADRVGISAAYAHAAIHKLDAIRAIKILSAPKRRLRIKIHE
jgi:ribosomal protein S25